MNSVFPAAPALSNPWFRRPLRRWRRWAFAAGLVAAAFAFDDRLLALLSQPWSGQANAALFAFRFFGEGVFVLALAAAWWQLTPQRRWAPIMVAAAAFLAGGLATGAKPLTARRRPEETLPAPAAASWQVPRDGGRNSSFPSGHTATAFALARGLGLALPPVRTFSLACALGTGASRVRELRHYPSDCAAAGLLGWCLAGWTWRSAQRLRAWRRAAARRSAAPPKLRLAG